MVNGCTVWGYAEAGEIRQIQKAHPKWIEVIDNMEKLEQIVGTKFDGTKQMPYFGAILTGEGKKHKKEIEAGKWRK